MWDVRGRGRGCDGMGMVGGWGNIHSYSGWWGLPTPLKNMKVNWDDELPNIWKNMEK